MGNRRPITAGCHQRVIGVRHADELDQGREFLPAQSVRVPTAVPPLMVVAADVVEDTGLRQRPEAGAGAHQLTPRRSVALYERPFRRRETARLPQNRLRHSRLAYIVVQSEVGPEGELSIRRIGNKCGIPGGAKQVANQGKKAGAVVDQHRGQSMLSQAPQKLLL